MRLIIKNVRTNPANALRKAGYSFSREVTETNEVSATRPLANGPFPRFHAYAHIENGAEGPYGPAKDLVINLHLDQKQPSYRGTRAHGGEYEGPLLEEEVKRIQQILEAQ